MKFENWTKHFSFSNKESYLNRILDKMVKGNPVSEREGKFLNDYGSIRDIDFIDLKHLSKNDVVARIQDLISERKKVMCELYDRDGRIDDEIVDTGNEFEKEISYLITKHGDRVKVFDRFFYNLEYRFENDTYYLYQGEEFVEKIEVRNEEN